MPFNLWNDIEDEFTLYGIRSKGMSESRFIFNLNKYYNYRFQRTEDLDICIDDHLYCFSLYVHINELDESEIYVIRNHSHTQKLDNPTGLLFEEYGSNKVILNKLKVFDYLLKLPMGQDEIDVKRLPLADMSFIQNISLIHSLSQKEKKLLII